MRDDDLIREVDRRHVIQLFDLFADSKYDSFDLIRAYSTTSSRDRADEGSEYHVLKQPINVFNDILRENNLKVTEKEVDSIILHWMAELYVYVLYEKGLSFREILNRVSPEWLYNHYSPLHETSLGNAWQKASCICAKES
jgi:hypothetical protein